MHEVDIDSTESEDESEHPFFVGVLNKVHSSISEEDKSWYSLLKIEDKTVAGLGGSVGCAVRLETRRSRVQPPPRSATFFRRD